jgi:pyruvate kinase
MKVIATIGNKSPILQNVDGIRLNGAFSDYKQIEAVSRRYQCLKLLDLPRNRTKRRTVYISDDELVELAVQFSYDYVGLSYIDYPDEIDIDRSRIKVCTKIETRKAVDNLAAIIKKSDIVMIDRRDLITSFKDDISMIPLLQKKIIKECHRQEKEVIVASEVLFTMTKSSVPSIAEVNDLSMFFSMKVDYILLSEETATGDFPQESIDFIKCHSSKMEKYQEL